MAAVDLLATYAAGSGGSAGHAAEVTPHNTNELGYVSLALYVGTAGSLKVTTVWGETVTLTNAAVGYHPLRVRVVFATGTTAAGIVALW